MLVESKVFLHGSSCSFVVASKKKVGFFGFFETQNGQRFGDDDDRLMS